MRLFPVAVSLDRFRPDRLSLLIAAIAVLGAMSILAREAAYGVGLIGDWATYISTARNLLAGKGFAQLNEWAYWHWPPLYPLLLAAASLGALDPYEVAGPLNAACFGLTLFVAGHCLRRCIAKPFLVIWACLAIMLALPLTEVASAALSEPPFILFTLLFLAQTCNYLESGRRANLVWAATFASMAFMTRYIGFVSITLLLILLFGQRGVAPSEKAKRIGLSLLITMAPMMLWLHLVFLDHGAFFGPRGPSSFTLWETTSKYLSDLTSWVFFHLLEERERIVVGGALLMLTAAGVGRAFIHWRFKSEGGWMPFCLFGGFALAHLAAIGAMQAKMSIEPLGERYLSIAYIPLLFVATMALDKFASRGGRREMLTALVLFAWLCCGATLNGREIKQAYHEGLPGAGNAEWVNAEILQYVREHHLIDEQIFSNATSLLYIHIGQGNYHHIHPGETDGVLDKVGAGDHIVWVDLKKDFPANPKDLLLLKKALALRQVAEFPEGSIFQSPRKAPAAHFVNAALFPQVGEPISARLAGWVKRAGFHNRQRWQWERGNDETGWVKVESMAGHSYKYLPAAADAGYRLRATVEYIDHEGKRVKKTAGPSEPVAATP